MEAAITALVTTLLMGKDEVIAARTACRGGHIFLITMLLPSLASSANLPSSHSNGYSNTNGYSGGGGYGNNGYGNTNGYGGGNGGDKMSNLGANLKAQNWDLSTLPKFEKAFYKEDAAVAARPQSEVDAFRREKQITVSGRDVPKPVETFDEAGFPG